LTSGIKRQGCRQYQHLSDNELMLRGLVLKMVVLWWFFRSQQADKAIKGL
jgi:hypothetical protein